MLEYGLNDYQKDAIKMAVYPKPGSRDGIVYTVLALCGEAGELANKLKKHLRAGTPIDEEALVDELGDVLWYVSAVAWELQTDLETVATANIRKLQKRERLGELVG